MITKELIDKYLINLDPSTIENKSYKHELENTMHKLIYFRIRRDWALSYILVKDIKLDKQIWSEFSKNKEFIKEYNEILNSERKEHPMSRGTAFIVFAVIVFIRTQIRYILQFLNTEILKHHIYWLVPIVIVVSFIVSIFGRSAIVVYSRKTYKEENKEKFEHLKEQLYELGEKYYGKEDENK